MKIISELDRIENIDSFLEVDYLVIPTQYSVLYTNCFNEIEISKIIQMCLDKDIVPVIKMDAIIKEADLDRVFNYIKIFINSGSMFMVSDFGLLRYFDKINKNYLVFYNSPTYITNSYDCEYYKNKGIKVFISTELNINEIKEVAENNNSVVNVYGYFPIYYTKRNVIGLYNDNFKLNLERINGEFDLIEETRLNEKYKLIEYIDHDCILTTKKLILFRELLEFYPEYIYINSYDVKNIKDVIRIYKQANFVNEEELVKLDSDVDKGMLYIEGAIL